MSIYNFRNAAGDGQSSRLMIDMQGSSPCAAWTPPGRRYLGMSLGSKSLDCICKQLRKVSSVFQRELACR